MCDFTVPSGVPVSRAISSCVRPCTSEIDGFAVVGLIEIIRHRLEFDGALAPPHPIDEPAARHHRHPPGLGGARGVEAGRSAPQIDEHVLHDVLEIARVGRPASREGPDQRAVARDALAYCQLVAGGHADLPLLVARLTHGPAKALGLAAGTLKAGALADLVLLDPQAAWTPAKADLVSKSGNNPLIGHPLKGRVRATFVGGRQVFGA